MSNIRINEEHIHTHIYKSYIFLNEHLFLIYISTFAKKSHAHFLFYIILLGKE